MSELKARITRLTGWPDAVDRLELEIDFTSSYGDALLLGFDGECAFDQTALSYGQNRNGYPGLRVPARWVRNGAERGSRGVMRWGKGSFRFAADLPLGALERIERRRDGGPMFLRLDGAFSFLSCGKDEGDHLQALQKQVFGMQSAQLGLACEPYEVPRDIWNRVLGELRDERRILVEVALPGRHLPEGLADELEGILQRAQAALDQGSFEEVLRLTYAALELMKKNPSQVKKRYGEELYKRIADQRSKLQGMANCERHWTGEGTLHNADRALALHLLISAKTLASLWFPASPEGQDP
jgi:hypothetical protein